MTKLSTAQDQAITAQTIGSSSGRVHVRDRHGRDPAFVLMHGFPDDSRIYHRLAPLLNPQRVVSFDFVGYGRSERHESTVYKANHQEDELAAVLVELGLEEVVLVAHDASGPVAVDFTIKHPKIVSHLVLLNTYYGHADSLRFPEMIRLLADEDFGPLADAMLDDVDQRLWLLGHTAQRFGIDPLDPHGVGATAVVPQFFGDAGSPDALPAIRSWTAALFDQLEQQDDTIASGQLAALDVPVTLVFGARDEYLGPELARHLSTLFADSNVHLIEDASHWPQWDKPGEVAQLIRRAVAV